MAEAALFVGWGEVARGREKLAVDVFNESVQYWTRLQQEGSIEGFDVAILSPHGGELRGFALFRGTAAQLDAVTRTDEWRERIDRANLIADGLGIVDAFVDEGLAKEMSRYRSVAGELV